MLGGEIECLLRGGNWLLIEPVFEDGFERAHGIGPEHERMATRRFETGVAVAFTEAQDREAGTVTLLGMATRGEYALDERGSGGATLLGPPAEARR